MTEFYGKREAKLIAGVGIFLMLIHHFFGFPAWRLPGNNFIEPIAIGGISIERVFAAFGKICVSIFAFARGFAIYKFPEQYNTPVKCLMRLFKFLIAYWIILLLFLGYGWLIGDPLPSLPILLKHNLIGNYTNPEAPYVNVPFAWYVMYYIFLMAIAPMLIWTLKNSSAFFDTSFAILLTLCVPMISIDPLNVIMSVLPLSVIGILCCKWHIFDRLRQKWNPSPILSIGVIIIIIACRQALIFINWGGYFEGIITTSFLFFTIIIFKALSDTNWLIIFFLALGKNSMNLWFLHGLFFTGSRPLQTVLYSPKYSFIILIWGIVILLTLNHIISLIQRPLINAVNGFSRYSSLQ